jgi:CRISPR-associated protein Cmr6
MTTPNLGWLYYRDFYNVQREEKVTVDGKPKGIRFSFNYLKYTNTEEGKEQKKPILKDNTVVLKERSQQFFDKKLSAYNPENFFKCEAATNSFELTTTYPGLLCGVGYNHGISSEADFKVGFYFDHTTGLPVIPGSSVKGVLRSAFPGYIRLDDDKKPSKEEMEERYKFFRWLIEETNKKIRANIGKLSNKEIDELEAFIFEGQDSKGEQISYYKRDRFFDAYPVRSLGKDGYFLKNDYITPHINREKPEMSPFTSPNPIQFLKVLPKVQFRFQFQLKEGGGLKEKQKELLFKEILCFMGAGAKTNVGYGQFEEGFNDHHTEKNKPVARDEPQNYTGKVKSRESIVEAKVLDQKSRKVSMKINGQDIEQIMSGICPTNGTIVRVLISDIDKKTGKIRNVTYQGNIKK